METIGNKANQMFKCDAINIRYPPVVHKTKL